MEVTANVGQQLPYPMETGKKISKIDVVIMRRGTLGDTQHRNTVTINGRYQNTTWKIVQIPIPHILITFIILLVPHTYGCFHLARLIIQGIYAPDVHVFVVVVVGFFFLIFW